MADRIKPIWDYPVVIELHKKFGYVPRRGRQWFWNSVNPKPSHYDPDKNSNVLFSFPVLQDAIDWVRTELGVEPEISEDLPKTHP